MQTRLLRAALIVVVVVLLCFHDHVVQHAMIMHKLSDLLRQRVDRARDTPWAGVLRVSLACALRAPRLLSAIAAPIAPCFC